MAQMETNAIRDLTAQQNMYVAGVRTASGAIEQQTIAMHGMRFGTANIAAQLQDIAVTAQMGQSISTIALQQGTQLAAVLNQAGGNLRSIIPLVGSAIVSVLNPVSLVTIGVVAATAAAIQWGIATFGAAEKASDAIENHGKWLKNITEGWKEAGDAAEDAIDKANKLPQGVVASDLVASLVEQEKAANELNKKITENKQSVAETITFMEDLVRIGEGTGSTTGQLSSVIDQVERLKDLNVGLDSTREELDAAIVAARELFNTTDDPSIKEMAERVYRLTIQLRALQDQGYASAAALAALNNAASLETVSKATDKASDAMERLTKGTAGLRSEREKASDDLGIALGSAPDQLQRDAAIKAYDEYISALDKRDEERAAKKLMNKESPDDKWSDDVIDFEEKIAQRKIENEAEEQGVFVTEKAAAALELKNKAMADGLEITPELTEQIDDLASRYAMLALEAEGAATTMANRTLFEELGDDIEKLDEQLAAGVISWETYQRAVGGATASAAATALGAIASLSAGLSAAFEDNKALSVATAVLKGAEAIASAYASGNALGGPVVGAAFAAVAAITAAANVAAVLNTTKDSKSISGSGGSAGAAAPAAQPGTGLFVQLIGNPNTPTTLGSVEGILREIQDYLGVDGKTLAIAYKGE